MRRTSAQLKILSVCAALSLFLWSSPTFPGLTTGNVYPVIIKKYSHFVLLGILQMVAPDFPSNCGSLGMWGLPQSTGTWLPPGRANLTLRGPSKTFTEVRRGSKCVVCFPWRYLDILYQEQTTPPESALARTISLCDLLHDERKSLPFCSHPHPQPNCFELSQVSVYRTKINQLFWGLIALGIQLMLHKCNLHISN